MITKEEYHQNENYLTIHIDRKLVKDGDVWYNTEYTSYREKAYDLLPWLEDMHNTDGIVSVSVRPYDISIIKATVFSWEVIVPKVMDILQQQYPDNAITEKVPDANFVQID